MANKKLSVKYFSQRDNGAQKHRTCNTSACWMGAMFMRPQLWEECGQDGNADYHFYLPEVNDYGDTTDHNAQTKAMADLGVESEFRRDLGRADVIREIDAGRPVVIGILHNGPVRRPRGGHMLLVIGYSGTGYYVHDPYGDLDLTNGGYPGSHNGADLHYSFQNLGPRFEVEGPGSGWGRIFKAVE